MNYKYRDFCKIYFGQKSTALRLKDFKKSRYSLELKNILQQHDLSQVVVLDQIHADIGVCVDDINLDGGSSILEHQGDFLISSKKNIALIVLTADCVPLILIDARKNIVALIHAGWRGSFSGVVERALQFMHERYQTNYSDIQAIFGPSARNCCYEVSQDFVENFTQKFGNLDAFFKHNELNYFDNNLFLQKILKKYGILEHNINIENSLCTICNLEYCSFRRENEEAKRQFTLVALK